MAIAVATFLVVLAVIATEKLHRTQIALLGAAVVVIFVGEFNQDKAIESVDFNTIGLLSAFLDNLTTILLVVPITFLLADALDIDPIPLIVIEVISSNIGGTATLIGDPPNIIIAGATGLSFNEFIVNLAPIALVVFVVVVGGLYLLYRRDL